MSRIKIRLQSNQDWSTENKTLEYLQILCELDDIYLPERFGRWEPAKHLFFPHDLTEPLKLWTNPQVRGLFTDRRKPFRTWFWVLWYYKEHRILNDLLGSVSDAYFLSASNTSKFLDFLRRLYLWGKPLHGYACHEKDFENKNILPWMTGGMRLQISLPGIYWANFFGPLYVEFFGREKFLSAPAYHKEEFPDGGFLLLTAPSPLDYGHPEVRALEEALIDHLGRDAFFEKAHPEKPCRAPHFTFEQAALGRPIEVVAYDPLPEVIPDPLRFIQEAPALAELLIRRFEGKLDYSPESLKQVDDFILKKSYRRPNPWAQEAGRQLLRELTAYFGEVLRRQLQGEWVVLEGSEGALHPAVVFTVGGVKQDAWPFARVIKLWVERVRADGLAVHYMLLQSGEWTRLEQHLISYGKPTTPTGT